MLNLSLRIFAFIIFLGLSGIISAEAKTIRCHAIFQTLDQDNLPNILEKIDHENAQFLLKGKSFQEYTQDFSWLRKRKIRKLVQHLEIRSFPSEKAIERYAIELGTALFGSREIVDRWLFKSKNQRLEESTISIIKEKLLREGLLKTWGDRHNPEKTSLLKKLLDSIWNIQNSKIIKVVRLPFNLLPIKDYEIPSELMYKVIRDGFGPHAEEVQRALRQQNKIEAYNIFCKLYGPVFFGVMMIAQVQIAYRDLEVAMDHQVQQTIQQLTDQRENIAKAIPLLKQEEFQKAYNASVAEFTQKWGEAPTSKERELLKTKIRIALFNH